MAFLTIEDLYGSVEVIMFPRDYENNNQKLVVDSKVFVRGRGQAEEEKDGKLICEDVILFEDIPRALWLQFASEAEFAEKEKAVMDVLAPSDGKDTVKIYITETKQVRTLPPNQTVHANVNLLAALKEIIGEENIRLV